MDNKMALYRECCLLLQPLRWRCAEYVVHHERNMCEEQHIYMWREQAIIE